MSRRRDAPLRVAVIARAVLPLHGVGGLERSVHDLVRHLDRRGVEVTLIVPPATAPEWASRPFDVNDALGTTRVRAEPVRYVTFPLANRRGTTVLDRSTAYLAFGLRAGHRAAALAGRGAVDVVHGFGASALGYAARARAAPFVLNPQGLEEFGATGSRPSFWKHAGYTPLRAAVRRTARAADAILATDVALESTVARHLSPRPGQMVTIPNGIDLAAVSALAGPREGEAMRARHGLAPDTLVLLSVGRLEFNKGFDVLVDALALAVKSGTFGARPWRWVIAGDGPFRGSLDTAIATLGLSAHVITAGRVSESDLHAWYEAATVFVHPTRYEGSSLVTLEAMAHRRAVVATRAGGLPDKVRPGETGWLVAPGDVSALAAAIAEAAADPARLDRWGRAGRALVEAEFDWPVLADRHIALYNRLLGSR